MKNSLTGKILLILTLSVLCGRGATCFSAPSIFTANNTVSNENLLTVTGSGFKTHPNFNEGTFAFSGEYPLNAKYKNFDDGSKISGGWGDAFPLNNTILSGGRIAGGKYLQERYVPGEERTQVYYIMTNAGSPSGLIYSSFWFMMPADTQAGKFWRVYLNGDSINSPWLATGCGDRNIRGSDNPSPPLWGSDSFGNDTWHRVEVELSYNRTSLTVTTWLDGVLQWTSSGWGTTSDAAPNSHSMDFGNMIDEPGPARCEDHPTFEGSYNYDDIFVNYTRSRLEICTGPTWETRGICEIQIPLSWDDGSITAVVNQGGFPNGTTAYIYVVDEDGAVSGGSPTRFSSQPSPLPAPTNLRVMGIK